MWEATGSLLPNVHTHFFQGRGTGDRHVKTCSIALMQRHSCWADNAAAELRHVFPKALSQCFVDDGFAIYQGNEQDLLRFARLLTTLLLNIRPTYKYRRAILSCICGFGCVTFTEGAVTLRDGAVC